MLNHEKLLCLATNEILEDDGLILENPACSQPSLLRTVYSRRRLQIREYQPGIFRYSDWLPACRILESDGRPITYASRGLGKALGLSNLYVTFSGYWPEIGALMTTGTFKECEAYSVCARFPESAGGVLVVASAGNTARAFIKVASDNEIPIAVVVPEKNLDNLWTIGEVKPCVKVIAAGGDSDYYDAIQLAGLLCGNEGFINEGGVKNVARRDGMGTTVLSAVEAMGRIPDYYFQAVGSGTGAIAAYEANLRLLQSGSFSGGKMRLIVSQNQPFTPMVHAWEKGSRVLDPIDPEEANRQIDCMDAKVLSNRKPPYSILGGLYDALRDTDGDAVAVDNIEARKARELFRETEGRDICPEAGVALASLIKKVNDGAVERDAYIMLNVTGGGLDALRSERGLKRIVPDAVIRTDSNLPEIILQKVSALFSKV